MSARNTSYISIVSREEPDFNQILESFGELFKETGLSFIDLKFFLFSLFHFCSDLVYLLY